MGSALGCVLAVDKSVIFLTILVGMGDRQFYVGSFEVDRRI